jgi:hypothetical protein
LTGFDKWRISFIYDHATPPPVQQSATSPCPSLELAGQLSDIFVLIENHPTPLLPEVGWNGAVFSLFCHDAAATPQFINRHPTSLLFVDNGAGPAMSPLASPTVPYTIAFASKVKLLQRIKKKDRWCKSFVATIKMKPTSSLAFTCG